MQLQVDNNSIELDKEGFLKNLTDWSELAAIQLANNENIELTEQHWEIIRLVQAFYKEFQISPSMRALVKYVAQRAGPEKGNSLYLLKLFPTSPAKYICKIAGLPKPANCL